MATDHNFKVKKGLIVKSGQTNLTSAGNDSSTYILRANSSSGAEKFYIRSDGVTVVSGSQYFYVTASGGAYFSHSIKARGGIYNDSGDLSLSDTVNITGDLKTGGTVRLDSSGNLSNIGTITSGAIDATSSAEEVIRVNTTGNTAAIHWRDSDALRGLMGFSNSSSIYTGADNHDMVIRSESKLHLVTNTNNLGITLNGTDATFGGKITATTVNTGHGDNELYAMNQNVRSSDSPTFDELTVTDFVKATGNNLKFSAGGTHVLNIDVNGKIYPNTHNAYDIGFSSSTAFRNAHFSGVGNFGTINTGQGATEVYLMNQNVRSSDSPTFQDLTIQGNLSITGDINSYNVTDLDVVDKTITLGVGGTASANDGGGIVVDGADAKLTWNNTNSYWQMNKKLAFNDTATTSNQGLGLVWSGFDKEATSDSTDSASIVHTTNAGGHTGSVLYISAQNDANDGIAFVTNASSYLKHNSNNIFTDAYHPNADTLTTARTIAGTSFNGSANIDISYDNLTNKPSNISNSDTVDGLHAASFLRSDADDSTTGNISFSQPKGLNFANGQQIKDNGGGGLVISSSYQINLNQSTGLTTNSNAIWHAGNDGSGSGLDADTLDGKEGADLFNFGYAYLSNNLSRAVGSGAQWYKVASFSGGVKHITMKVHSSGDNTVGADAFFISCGSYGMKAQIVRMPSTKYNTTKLEEVRTKYVSGATYEIWVKVASITTSVGYLRVSMNDSGVTSSLSAGTEPSVGSADATLPITASDRINYSLQATSKIEAMGGFVVDGSTVWHAGNDGSGSGLDADTLDGVNSGSFLRSDTADTGSGKITLTAAEGLEVFGIRGRAVGSQSGDFIQMYERVSIGYPSGWGAGGANSAPTQGLTTHGGAMFNTGNVSGAPLTFNSNTIWHAGNDGSGSGLDADTLDGRDTSDSGGASKVMVTNSSGNTSLGSGRLVSGGLYGTGHNSSILPIWQYNSSNPGYGIGYYESSPDVLRFDVSSNLMSGTADLELRPNELKVNGNVVYHVGNDGSGSGLDADTLDGTQKTGFFVQSGSWLGDLGSNGYTREHGVSMTGGSEFVVLSKGGQGTVLVDGQYISYEGNNGFFGSYNSSYGNASGIRATAASTVSVMQLDGGNANLAVTGSLTRSGNTVWDAGNDGSGSGLDADLLDGLHASSFLRLDSGSATPQLVPANRIKRFNSQAAINSTSGSQSSLEVYGNNGAGTDAFMTFHVENDYALYFGLDGGTNDLAVGGWSKGANSYKVWHAGNDGSTSGLDADLLDGQHGSYYKNASNLDAGTIPAARLPSPLNSSQAHAVTGSAFATTSSPGSVLEYQQASGQTDTKLAPSGDWYNTIRMGHGNPYSYYSNTLAMQMTGSGAGKIRTQLISNNSAQGWRTIWDSTTDGSGSGLDADLLDGQHGSYYAPATGGSYLPLAGGSLTGAVTSNNNILSRNNTIDDETLFAITDQDTTASIISKFFNQGSGSFTKADDSSAPASGVFDVAGAINVNPFGDYIPMDDETEIMFECWAKHISGSDTSGNFYAGGEFYNGSKSSYGNVHRYWGANGDVQDSDTPNPPRWRHIKGVMKGSAIRAQSNSSDAQYVRLLTLFNYNTTGNTTRFCGYRFYRSKKTVSSLWLKTHNGNANSDSAWQNLESSTTVNIIDNSGNINSPGNITVSGTVDGVDIAARNSVLTSTTTTANAALPKAGGTITGGLTISGSVDPAATDFGFYQSAGTNLILKGDASGRSGIFFESEKNGTNINDPSDYGFIQFHSYGHGGSSGESIDMVIGTANDSDDHVILQSPYNGGVKVGYRDTTSGTGLTTQTVFHDAYHPNADTLTTARTIAGTSFNGSANININYNNLTNKPTIPTNNNQLTNGAGYITSVPNHSAALITSGNLANARMSTAYLATQLGNDTHGLTTLNTTALWSKPAGYQTMVRASNSNGLPSSHGQSYFGYNITSRRDTGGGYSALLTTYDNSNMWFTYQSASSAYPTWRKLWHDSNDGSGSGLDADTVDGIQASQFLRSDADDTVTAGTTYTFPASDSPAIISTRGNGGASLYVGGWSGGTNSNNIHRISSSSNLHIDSAANGSLYLNYYSGTTTYIGGANVAWHAGNDGSGSGLDADTLDGINSGSFLRSDAADTGSGQITFSNGGVFATNGVRVYRQSTNSSIWFNGSSAADTNHVLWNAYYGTSPTTRGSANSGFDGMYWNTYRGLHIRGGSAGAVDCIKITNSSGAATDHNVTLYASDVARLATTTSGVSVTGSITASGDVVAFSDEKLKDDIQVIENAVEKVKQVRGVTFTRNDLEDQERYAGVIAQEVEKVLPEVVGYNKDTDTKTVAYGNMVGLLVEAVKEQQQQIEELKQQVKDLQGQK